MGSFAGILDNWTTWDLDLTIAISKKSEDHQNDYEYVRNSMMMTPEDMSRKSKNVLMASLEGKSREHQSLGFIFWAPWTLVETFIAFHPIVGEIFQFGPQATWFAYATGGRPLSQWYVAISSWPPHISARPKSLFQKVRFNQIQTNKSFVQIISDHN